MRLSLAICACAAVLASVLLAAEPQRGTHEPPTAEAIISIRGSRFPKLLNQFGTPLDFKPIRRKSADDDYVLFDYGSFGFLVRDKQVQICFIWSDWKEPIRGIRIGDSREQVLTVLGANPRYTQQDKDGAVMAYGYELNGLNSCFFANFDEKGKLERVEISAP